MEHFRNRSGFSALAMGLVFVAAGVGCNKIGPPKPPAAASQDRLRAASEAVAKAPTFDNYTQLGLIQLEQGDPAAAVKSFEQTAKINDQSAIAYNNLCAAYNGMKHWSRGISACTRALAFAPEMQLAKNNLNYATNSQRKAAERIAALEDKVHKDLSDSESVLQLGMEFYTQGEYQKALAAWKRAPAGSSNEAVIQNNIASAAILVKDFATASQAIEKALAAQPTNALFLNNKNWLLQAQREAGAARP